MLNQNERSENERRYKEIKAKLDGLYEEEYVYSSIILALHSKLSYLDRILTSTKTSISICINSLNESDKQEYISHETLILTQVNRESSVINELLDNQINKLLGALSPKVAAQIQQISIYDSWK